MRHSIVFSTSWIAGGDILSKEEKTRDSSNSGNRGAPDPDQSQDQNQEPTNVVRYRRGLDPEDLLYCPLTLQNSARVEIKVKGGQK